MALGLGDQLRLETPASPLMRPVVGILEFYYVEEGTVFMDRELSQEVLGRQRGRPHAVADLEPGVDRSAFKTEINRAAGRRAARVHLHQ